MMSQYRFIDGRDPDNVFTAGNAGIVTELKHDGNGSDLGSLYVSGNSGIVTGLKAANGTDIGSLFGTSVPSLSINGQEFTAQPTKAGGISTCILGFTTNNASWSVTGAQTSASGSIPSGATSCEVTVTYQSGATGTAITNPMTTPTGLTAVNDTVTLHLSASQSSPVAATYNILIQYFNGSGTLISSTNCTFFLNTAAS